MLNRVIQGAYSPGSTFKPIMAMAGLEDGKTDESLTTFCPGGATFYGRHFACHLKGGHGTVDLHKAIAQSCDVYFYNLGNRLGIDKIAEYAEYVWPGEEDRHRSAERGGGTGSLLALEDPDYPREVVCGRDDFGIHRAGGADGDAAAIGERHRRVGDGRRLVYAARGGRSGAAGESPARGVQTRRIWRRSSAACSAVVNEGTGRMAQVAGIEICGKTGTAQLASNKVLKGTRLGQEMKDNAWFVGFAPRQNPEIVVVALVEGGLHGATAAAPVARDLIKTYFEKKAKSAPPRSRAGRSPRTGNVGQGSPWSRGRRPTVGPRLSRQRGPARDDGQSAPQRRSASKLRRQGTSMAEYRSARDLDWPLLLISLALCALGTLQIYSATIGSSWRQAWWKQVVFVLVGLVLMYVISRIDYHALLEHVPVFYVLSMVTLVVVLFAGRQVFGSRRWIPLPGGFTFQVSEFAKLVIILLTARYLSELKNDRPEFRDLLKLGALVALPMALVMKQPDLGTALTYGAILAAGRSSSPAFAGGTPPW